MLTIYSDNKYKRYLKHRCKKQFKRSDNKIKIDCVHDGIIANEHEHGFGVFDSKNKFIKSSLQCHLGGRGQFVPKTFTGDIPYIDKDVIYLCNMGKYAFGHFLIDHLNRAWPLTQDKYKKMTVVLVNELNITVPEYMYNLLEVLGIKRENILVLDKTTKFRNVYIPYSCFDVDGFYSDKFAKMYNKMSSNVPDTEIYEKIYVSRAKLPDARKTWGEEKIQNIFKKNGYHIIYPETLPLKQQIAYVKNCKYLAGCAGTALHLALFMKSGRTVIQIKRNTMNGDNAYAQHMINKTIGLNSIFISGSVESVKSYHFSNIPQIIGVTDYMKQFFDDNKFIYSESDLKPDAKEWAVYKKIIESCCNKPDTVNSIKRHIILYLSIFIPGRERRARFRTWFAKNVFKIGKM